MKFFYFLCVLLCADVIFADDLLVTVKQGTIRGHLLTTPGNTTFKAFNGIPFAEPPVGSLRFQAPRPPISWEGILDATKSANNCYVFTADPSSDSGNEDCLYLDVFTPVYSKENETSLPVLISIHGGGYTHGSAGRRPDYIIEKDIIVVTVNYRLGPVGFLATGDTVIPGNSGHKDQAAGIKWTYENIARFGGDPKKITLIGASAGGSSVGYQLLYKGNKGRVRGAILQSGSPLSPWSFITSSSAREYAFDLAKNIDSSVNLHNDSTKLRDFLIKADIKSIDYAATKTTIKRTVAVMEPEHDGAFMTESQYELLESGDFIRVPILIGTNSEEEIHQAANLVSLKKYLDKFETQPQKLIPADFKVKNHVNITKVGNSIKDLYYKDVPEDVKMGHTVRYMSHTSFTLAMIKHADLASNFTDVYFYVFSYDGVLGNYNVTIKGADKIDHSEGDQYLWKSAANADLSKLPKSDVTAMMRRITLWTNFVKYLNPTPVQSDLLQNITWPKVVPDHFKYVDFGNNLEIKINPKNPYYKAWSQFYDDWAERPFTTF